MKPPEDRLTQYGFTYGPAEVTRMCHIEGRGRVLQVKTPHAELQVLVSEKGRRITAYPVKNSGAA